MARPRSFSTDDALDAAREVFRRLGYEATSVQDLVDATGLSRSSLYAAFGDKHRLYLAVLDRTRTDGHAALADILAGSASSLDAIRGYLRSVVEEGEAGGAPPPGCLMTNAAIEVASRDPETLARTRQAADGLSERFACAVERAQGEGTVAPERDASALGRFLAATVYGLRGMQKAGVPPDALREVIETALAAIEDGGTRDASS